MPANLPPQYHEAEKRYRRAGTPDEKMDALKEMLAVIPKHKGTEKLQGDIKRRLAQAREQRQKGPAGTRTQPHWVIDKVGAGQVPVIGPPNAGKSALIARLTSADARVAEYPFTTQMPAPAMLPFENIQIQLIDGPPYSEEYGVDWIPELIRRADACVVLADLSDSEAASRVHFIVSSLEERDVVLVRRIPPEREGFEIYVPTLLAANKLDAARAPAVLSELEERFGERFPIASFSVETGEGLDGFKAALFEALSVIRVFTKEPGDDADLTEPFVLDRGSTVRDLAGKIHKDFLETLRYARIWGSSGKFDGQRAGEDHVLEDGDIVELHTR